MALDAVLFREATRRYDMWVSQVSPWHACLLVVLCLTTCSTRSAENAIKTPCLRGFLFCVNNLKQNDSHLKCALETSVAKSNNFSGTLKFKQVINIL